MRSSLETGPDRSPLGWRRRPLLVAAVLLLVVHLPAEAQANDRDVNGVTVTSPNPGELVIAWDAPGNAPDDYRVTWKKSDGEVAFLQEGQHRRRGATPSPPARPTR